MTLRTIATITLNTAPQAKAFRIANQGSRPNRSVFLIHMTKRSGSANADAMRTARKDREIVSSAIAVAADQRSSVLDTCARIFACAAASRATGTRKGEQDT